ncbi:MAG: hypothetical protein ISR65_01335 [Bacteriovoracaceae bacterium]|nr:hypothetical protein [Bacteriovoracaceae bacterium]
MKLNLYNFQIKRDFDRIQILHYGHFLCLILAVVFEMSHGFLSPWGVVRIFIFTVYYRMYYRTVRGLYYTFWTFSFFICAYLLIGLIQSVFIYKIASLILIYTMALCLFAIQIYILSAPIYFPRVRWWEYDFRYRYDLKVKVIVTNDPEDDDGEGEDSSADIDEENYTIDGRLTDLRRKAGCVVLFDEFETGKILRIIAQAEYKEMTLKAEIMSKREYSIGRGITYGVKFHFDSDEEMKDFKAFSNYWRSEGVFREKMKFSKKVLDDS